MDKSARHVGFSLPSTGEDELPRTASLTRARQGRGNWGSNIRIPTRMFSISASFSDKSPSPFTPASLTSATSSPGSGDSMTEKWQAAPKVYRDLEAVEEPGDETAVPEGEEVGRRGPTSSPDRRRLGEKDKLPPESAITLFALRLAALEKAASNLGTLAFLWATVVLLGGFATTAKSIDFWIVAVLLVTEGVRIYARSHELEWQHVASKATKAFTEKARRATSNVYKVGSDAMQRSSQVVKTALHSIVHKPENAEHGVDHAVLHESDIAVVSPRTSSTPQKTDSGQIPISKSGDRAIGILKQAAAKHGGNRALMKRTWSTAVVPFIPYSRLSLFSAQAISLYLYWMQICSAISSVVLSSWRLYHHDFIDPSSDLGKAASNLILALDLFYGLALAEAAIFLFERFYWEVKLTHEQLIVNVSNDYYLPEEMHDIVKAFFYDVYSKSLEGSVFTGLDMDLVAYSIDLIQSDTPKDQLAGSQLLTILLKDRTSAEASLRRLGSTPRVFERLVEMLSWHNENEEQIRSSAAEIVSRLVLFTRNTFRIAGIAGALEGIVTLLGAAELNGLENTDTWDDATNLRLLGLRILKYLARDHNNRARIGATRSLLPILVSFTHVKKKSDFEQSEVGPAGKVFKKSLEILSMLASTSGTTGTQLRASILHVIFAVRNLRDILQYGSSHPRMQNCAVELLTYLAMDDDVKVRESLGGTGGLIRNLVYLLLFQRFCPPESPVPHEKLKLAEKAGETLNLLALQNEKNCRRMIQLRDLETGEKIPTLQYFMDLVPDPYLGAISARILRSFCVYATPADKAQLITIIPHAFRIVMEQEEKHQESALGLGAQALSLATGEYGAAELDRIFSNIGVDKHMFVLNLMKLIPLETSRPRLRRHAVELMNALMDADQFFVKEFREAGLERKLHSMLETVWEIENYYTFSGHVGLTRHQQDMEDLVRSAQDKLLPLQSAEVAPSV